MSEKEVLETLKKLYFNIIKPIEEQYYFHEFHSSPLTTGDFDAKPRVFLLGQHSSGKTSFIRHLLGKDIPGSRIGPEPTTDKFMVIRHGLAENRIPGNTLVLQTDSTWSSFQKFGVGFLDNFECSEMQSSLLETITFIDSPGLLTQSTLKKRNGFDFYQVDCAFAEKVDKVLVFFDAHKLDISDDLKKILIGMNFVGKDKIAIVFNKMDGVSASDMMRCYGALSFSLTRIIETPEMPRIYIGSFWEKIDIKHSAYKLFNQEEKDLISDLKMLPKQSTLRKVQNLLTRCQILKVHLYLISYLRDKMPTFFGKDNKSKSLLDNLDQVFVEVQKNSKLPVGDFPDINKFRQCLLSIDMNKLNKVNSSDLKQINTILETEIPNLIEKLNNSVELKLKKDEKIDNYLINNWPVSTEIREIAKQNFMNLLLLTKSNEKQQQLQKEEEEVSRVDGKLLRIEFEKTGLDKDILRSIWTLSSIDGKSSLDLEEYTLALYFIEIVKSGEKLPNTLPPSLIPPSKRSI